MYLYNPAKADLFDEFVSLIKSAGKDIVEIFTQDRYPTSGYYFGSGFVEEVGEEIAKISEERAIEIDYAIIGTQLTPLQIYNISQHLPIEIMDKFELVLEIFAKQARSLESVLQVELAKLMYTRNFERSRLTGKVFGRFGTERRGFGATGQLKYSEVLADYRAKEYTIKQKLKKITRDRAVQRENRKQKAESDQHLRIALVGYTNAGKSSLLNILTDSEVEVKDQLFTTLGTTTRQYMHKDLPVMFTDTVGFIQDLPTSLIDAFRSTLEESVETEFVGLVIDVSDDFEEIQRKIKTSLDTLEEIGVALGKQVWLIFNKIDQIPAEDSNWIQEWIVHILEKFENKYPYCFISAKTGDLDQLMALIEQHRPAKRYQVILPIQLQTIRSSLHDQTEVIQEHYNGDDHLMQLEIKTRRPNTFLKLVNQAKKLNLDVSYMELF